MPRIDHAGGRSRARDQGPVNRRTQKAIDNAYVAEAYVRQRGHDPAGLAALALDMPPFLLAIPADRYLPCKNWRDPRPPPSAINVPVLGDIYFLHINPMPFKKRNPKIERVEKLKNTRAFLLELRVYMRENCRQIFFVTTMP